MSNPTKFLDFCRPYTTKKDEEFELFKNNIVANSLGRDVILSNIDKIRESQTASPLQQNKP